MRRPTEGDIPDLPSPLPPTPLFELALLFLRLGTTAFGGPAAHIAMMEEEVVRRRGWLTHAQFLDLLGAANLIPGPNSTELAIHIGHQRAGWKGLVVSGVCFILPAALIVSAFAWTYARFGRLPQVEGVLYGVKPVIIAVVFQALWGLLRSALKTRTLVGVALLTALLSLLGVSEVAALFGAGVLVGGLKGWREEGTRRQLPWLLLPLGLAVGIVSFPFYSPSMGVAASGHVPFGLTPLFLFFLKVGSVLYGSGYVLLAFLRTDLVSRFGWLTSGQLLDAVAVGQVTPGPVFTTATFIGYLLGGGWGAVVATLGIFLPSFLFIAVSGPLIPRLRKSPVAGAFLDGVNAAALALMGVVTWQLGRAAMVDAWTTGLAVSSGFLLIRYKPNSVWLILAGAVVGFVLRYHP